MKVYRVSYIWEKPTNRHMLRGRAMSHRKSEIEFEGKTYVIQHRVIDSQVQFDALWEAVQAKLAKGGAPNAAVHKRMQQLEAKVVQLQKVIRRY
jgi:hypothetical protein